jgi:DNA-binding transcriptional MerR regulator
MAQRVSGDAGSYSGKQACEIVGISYRQLDYWDRQGVVCPSLSAAHGSGTQRKYSYRDLVRLRMVKNILDSGVQLKNARKAIEYLREEEGADWQTASIVLAEGSSIVARDEDALVDLVRRGQGVLNIVPIATVVGEVDDRIVGLAEDAPAAGGARAAEGG